jgi:hypothetical protein
MAGTAYGCLPDNAGLFALLDMVMNEKYINKEHSNEASAYENTIGSARIRAF